MDTAAESQAISPGEGKPSLEDEEVVARVLDGDTALFEVLMRRHNRRVYRAVRAIVWRESEVEDVMQQTYLCAFANLAGFRGEARFSTWLVRIALNEATAHRRRTRRFLLARDRQRRDDDATRATPMNGSDPEVVAARDELLARIERAADALPEIYQVVFMLRDVEGLSTAATAECMGLSEQAVKVRLHRARAMLRQRVHADLGSEPPDVFPFQLHRCDQVVGAVLQRIRGRSL